MTDQFSFIAELNATKKVAAYYPMDETSGTTISGKLGYEPDLIVGDSAMLTGWLEGNGDADNYGGFISDGTATPEEQVQNLFELNNGFQLVAFQFDATGIPAVDQYFMSIGGQSTSTPSTRRAVDYLMADTTAFRQQVITDSGSTREFPFQAGHQADDYNNIVSVVFINDCRSGITENGAGRAASYIAENGKGLAIDSSNSTSDHNLYKATHFGNMLGYPSGMTAGVGLQLGARWDETGGVWYNNAPFKMRRLLVMNLKKADPGSLSEIAYEYLATNGKPGQAVYRGILNA